MLILAVPASSAFTAVGPPLYVYATGLSGTAGPANVTEASAFNQEVFGAAAPPAADLTSSNSAYDGVAIDLTAAGNVPSGMANLACTLFLYQNANGCVDDSAGSVIAPNEPVATQSWPFYVGSGASSNVNPGTFTLQTETDDGSWLSVAPAAFAYAQPANFGPVTGLTAGTSVVDTTTIKSASTVAGTFAVGTPSACTTDQHLVYQTFEYFEAEGGAAQMHYSWELPGATAQTMPTQAVLYGEVYSNGAPLSGASVSLPATQGQAAATLTTDAQGCFGYNYLPTWAGSNTVGTVTATNTAANGGLGSTQTAVAVTMGGSTALAFNFVPVLTLTKSHTATFLYGSTATYQLVVSDTLGNAPTVNPITIVDTLPAGLTYSAAATSGTNWSCTSSGQIVTCTYSGTALAPGSVPAATAPTLNLGVNVGNPATSVTNSAVATTTSPAVGSGTTTITSNPATDTTTIGSPGIMTKTVQNVTTGEASGLTADTGVPGNVLRYSLTFTNAGSGAITGLVLTDPVPPSTTYLAGSAACGTAIAGVTCVASYASGTVTWTFTGSFPGNTATTVTFEATIN